MATRHSHLGTVRADLVDLTGARTHFDQALEIGQATLGPDHPRGAAFRDNLSKVVQQVGGK
jgi:Tetratricopeptide repeat